MGHLKWKLKIQLRENENIVKESEKNRFRSQEDEEK